MQKKFFTALLISLIVLITTIGLYAQGFLQKPEFFVYDTKVKLFRSDKLPPPDIKLILVDDASLKALEGVAGRWPWPRAIWADLLEFLSFGEPRAVLFDILFTERTDELNDRTLADATAAARNVYHSMIIQHQAPDDDRRYNAQLGAAMPANFVERFALKTVSGTVPQNPGRENNDFSLPVEPVRLIANGVAVVEFRADSDNVFRRTKPLREYGGHVFPVLGLAPFIDENSQITIGENGIMINDRTLPVDDKGNSIINMIAVEKVKPYSIGGIFSSLSRIKAGDVEDLLVNPEEFRDAIVFVGASAVATSDLKSTPLASSTPGVALHIALASNYLQNDFLAPPDSRLTYLAIFLGACLVPWTVFYSRLFLMRAVLPVLMLVLYVGFSFLAFKSNMLVEVVPFILATVTSSFLSFGYVTFTEAAEKRRVSQLFTQYVSKDVLNAVLHNYKEYQKASAGTKVEITVLFSDIRGFTTMSETTPPEKIVEMLNVHFSLMADIILKRNGTIDKYIGDAIMAFWGAPLEMADHPEQAVLAAREMVEAVREVNKTLKNRGFEHEVKIGVGLNTGVVTLGEIGSEKKKNYTIVGDTVNLASRLESVTKEHDAPLVFSEYTYEKIKHRIDCKLLGNIKVKGREQPVTIYTVE